MLSVDVVERGLFGIVVMELHFLTDLLNVPPKKKILERTLTHFCAQVMENSARETTQKVAPSNAS